ncbi:MAG: hypothetical protein Q9226_008654 [Calogaya cf. arnoldii]
MMQDLWGDSQQSEIMAEPLFGAMSPSQVNSRPIIRLPPMPTKASYGYTYATNEVLNVDSSHVRAYQNHHGAPLPTADTGTWQERFKQLTGNTVVQNPSPPVVIMYDAFGDPVRTTEQSSDITSSSSNTTVDTVVPQDNGHDHQKSANSTPPSTVADTSTASISSQTAALLMEGAKSNWKNICEALLVGVSLEDKKILEQIAMLVERLGTGSGPLSLAHRPCFTAHDVTAADSIGDSAVFTWNSVERDAIEGAATQQAEEEAQAGKDEKEEEEEEMELQARRERIATSLLMRRQEQPIMK